MPNSNSEKLKVHKRDGTVEEFDRRKVLGSMPIAGATSEEADSIALQVEAWAHQNAQDGVIKSTEIRKKVLELLRPVNAEAAAAYEAYKKPARR